MPRKTLNEDDHKLLMAVRLGHVRTERSARNQSTYDFWVGETNVNNRVTWLYKDGYVIWSTTNQDWSVNEDLVQGEQPNE